MKNENRSALIIAILIPIAAGTLSAYFSGNMSVYSTLNKPSFSPPGFVFPLVWLALYVLMGISSYIISESVTPCKGKALKIYGIQLLFNFFWSIIFFGFSQYFLAFIWLILLIVLIVLMIYQFFQISPISAYLQIPYLIWCIYAAYLNFMIWRLN